MVDCAACFALRTLLSQDLPLPSFEMKVNSLPPFRWGTVLAEAEVVHSGQRSTVAGAKVRKEEGRLRAWAS